MGEGSNKTAPKRILRSNWLKGIAFLLLVLFYVSWITGFTFRFTECSIWPNYNMLARAFAKGQLYLDETGLEDFSIVNGKAYLYFGS